MEALPFGCGPVSVVRLLLKDPSVDVTLDNNDRRTPLWSASYYGQHEVIEWLIANGRDLGDFKNKEGNLFDKDYPALEIARKRERRLKLCLCLKDSWPTLHRPAMNFV